MNGPRTPLKQGKGGTRSVNKQLALKQDKLTTMTAADAETGTSTTPMVVTPKVLHDEIARQIAAIP